MPQIIVAVKDRQLSAYMRPFVAQSRGQAIRSFRDEVNRKESELNMHPEDYELYELGMFEEGNGIITPHKEGPQQIAIASNLHEGAKK